MRTLLATAMLVIVLATPLVGQNCPNWPTDWGLKLPAAEYTVAFDGVMDGVQIDGLTGRPADTSKVKTAIGAAAVAWTRAANGAGTVIMLRQLPTSRYAEADIKVRFTDINACGRVEQGRIIELDNRVVIRDDQEMPLPWGTNRQPDKVDLQTIITHEMGHVFLGGDHWNWDTNSVMVDWLCLHAGVIRRELSRCDSVAVLAIYNPEYQVTVRNSFGGGVVAVDEGRPGGGIFPSGTTFTWRRSTFPHRLRAIDQSFADCFRRWYEWSDHVQRYFTNPLLISAGAQKIVTYTADFRIQNNAPVISTLTAMPQYAYWGETASIAAGASDPDGHPLSYSWSIDGSGIGYQYWYSENIAYVTNIDVSRKMVLPIYCTASDPCGGSDTRHTSVTLFPSYDPSCPYVYTWNGNEFVQDNNILPTSEFPENIGRDVTDYYKLYQPLVVKDGYYVLQIREFENEHSYFDQFKLLAVDHPKPVDIAVAPDGEIITFKAPKIPKRARHGDRDVTQEVSAHDGDIVRGVSGDNITLAFEEALPQGEPDAALLMIAMADPPSTKKVAGSLISPAPAGKTINDFVLREKMSLIAVRMTDEVLDSLEVGWDRNFILDYMGLNIDSKVRVNVQELPLRSARHSGGLDVTDALSAADNNYAELAPGEHIELAFEAPRAQPGKRRSFILETRGRYIKGGQKSHAAIAYGDNAELTLRQNYPNPFNPATSISYYLPFDAFVSLKVYNILGQEVASLVEGKQQAGNHQVEFGALSLPSGTYFARLVVAPYVGSVPKVITQRMMLMK